MKQFLKYNGPAILWALFIFIMCNMDMGSVGRSHLFFPGFDKLVHCGFFFVFVVFTASAYVRKTGADNFSFLAAFLIVMLAVVYGGVIELLQLTIFTWRTSDWGDLFADTVGACMAMFCILITIGTLRYEQK